MRVHNSIRFFLLCFIGMNFLSGCRSPYYSDRMAAVGGLTGAGVGAIVGNKLGDTGAGTAIGAGIGALTGAVVGNSIDEIQAENRAAISAQLGRQIQPGAATIDEVVSMSKAGVDSRLITTYIQNSGLSRPLSAADVIHLHQQGVATNVIQALQSPAPRASQVRTAGLPRRPVVIEEHYYDEPCFAPSYHHYRRSHHRPNVGWGISFSN